jgi:hypothetical protein
MGARHRARPVLLPLSVAGLEWLSRIHRVGPTVSQTMGLWYFWRQQINRTDGKVIVFIGTSRVAADVSLDTIRECLPGYRVIQHSEPDDDDDDDDPRQTTTTPTTTTPTAITPNPSTGDQPSGEPSSD